MKKGIVLFAHNSRDVDYALISMVAGQLAKKNLELPVTLIADNFTVDWMKTSKVYNKAKKIFESIIEIPQPPINNARNLHDGLEVKKVPFINFNRADVWELTPYDKTLLIDSDFLIFSSALNNYWDIESDVLLAPSMTDIRGDRKGVLDSWVSDEGVPMYWATTVMFNKTKESKLFFETVSFIRNNYELYSEIFRFDNRIYRNDISFSVAKHLLDGFVTSGVNLPSILTCQDKDLIHSIDTNGIKVLVNDPLSINNTIICNVKNRDVHIMNKQAIVRIADKVLEAV